MKYKLVPVKPTPEMIHAGQMAVSGFPRDVLERWEAMLAAAPEVEQEPYAYEYGRDNGDGTLSVVMNKGMLTQLGENEYGYCHPGIFASKEWPVTPLYLRPQSAPEAAKLVEALQSLLDMQDEDCRYDHQGYCQNHNLDHVDEGCRVAKARYTLMVHQKGGDV